MRPFGATSAHLAGHRPHGTPRLPALLHVGRTLRLLLPLPPPVPVYSRLQLRGGGAGLRSCSATRRRASTPSRTSPLSCSSPGTIVVAGVFLVQLRGRVEAPDRAAVRRGAHRPADGAAQPARLPGAARPRARARAAAAAQPISVLVGDLDHFKGVNDRAGHHAGDAALQAHRRRCCEAKRRIDVPARIGGEEFALVLPETDEHGAFVRRRAAALPRARAFAEAPVPAHDQLRRRRAIPRTRETRRALLRAADEALYAAKELGRDRTRASTAPRCAASLARRATRGAATRPSAARDGARPRRGARRARQRQRAPLADRRPLRRADGARAGPVAAERWSACALAGVLHDVGKIGVSDAILRKPGPLDRRGVGRDASGTRRSARGSSSSRQLDDMRAWVARAPRAPRRHAATRTASRASEIPLEARSSRSPTPTRR